MKVLLVSPHYPPAFMGGVELCTQRLAHRLAAAGHRPAVVAVEQLDAPQGWQVRQDTDRGVPIHRLALPPAGPDAAFAQTYRPAVAEAWLRTWLADVRPDVVHLHSGYLLGGAVLAAAGSVGIPVVVTLHDFWFICPRVTMLHADRRCCTGPGEPVKCAWCLATTRRRYRVPERWLGPERALAVAGLLDAPWLAGFSEVPTRVREVAERRRTLLGQLAAADAVLSPSHFVRDELGRAGVDPRRISLLPYGIEPRRRLPRRVADGPRLRIGFLGQIAPHKGVHVLIDAVRALPDQPIELVVHGPLDREADYVADLRRRAGTDARIVFAGPLGHADLDGFLGRIDALVVPSVWYENSPFVIHEARAAGLPVVASKLGGMAELVRDGIDGLLVEPGSASALATALETLLGDASLIDRLRAEVRVPPTIDEEVSALLAIYARVSTQHGSAS